jgi:ATP-dependent helicase HrpB
MTDSRPGDILPALAVIDELRDALAGPGAAVLVAPPGTGKTTAVPPALLDEAWVDGGRLLVVEPRRLAARAAATRMADVAGEPVCRRFGYSVRGDSSVSAATRVEVVTEGLFLRRLQADPELTGVAGVLLDEFHERSIDTDLSLALLADVRGSLRPDLRLVVMSATIDPEPVAALLRPGEPVPVVRATAPLFPVETRYRPGSAHDPLEDRVTTVVLEALRSDPGDVLVFLPGRPEIHRCVRRLATAGLTAGVRVAELHGSLSPAEQEQVVALDPEHRRVILSTSLAETSITVPGVRVVVDAGRRRTVRTDAHTGLPAMTTVAASRAAADQRRGRAGRLGPGVAYRLWAESDDRHRPTADTPEIVDGDLAAVLLQLRAWGVRDPAELAWLDPPPAEPLTRAAALLATLGALDDEGALTPLGRDMAGIGFHPRLAAIALAADGDVDQVELAAELLAILETSRSGEVDVAERVRSLRSGDATGDARHALAQWRRTLRAGRGRAANGRAASGDEMDADVARLLLAGFPDRVALRRSSARRDDRGREVAVFHLRSGGEVSVPGGADAHHLASADWLVVADLDAGVSGRSGRLHLGAAVAASVVLDRLGDQVRTEDVVEWDPDRGDLRAVRRRTLGAFTIDQEVLRQPPDDLVAAAVRQAVVQDMSLLGRWEQAATLRARVAFLRATQGDDWPDWSETALAASVDEWLGPFLGRARRRADLARIDVAGALGAQLDWAHRRRLDELAPTRWQLAGGRAVALEYGTLGGDPGSVTMSVRLRDLLGTDVHPTVAGVPVSVELLSPAGRPLQRTADLPGFWRGSYAQVRAEMRGRYPKHPWPERPWEPM